jgi:nanoRNase/pAp phosphatase (c-di-AMP/oligoRNAs hydrolase)
LIYSTNFLKKLNGAVLILGHHNADPDALGAALGVKELIEKKTSVKKVNIVFPEGPSNLSRDIISALGIEVKEYLSFSPDAFIVVDSGSLKQLEKYEEVVTKSNSVKIFIDHHLQDNEIKELADYYLIDENSSSTSEIVYELFKKQNLVPSKNTAKALLSGILFDTKFLSIGSSETFKNVSKLLKIVDSISEVRELMQYDMEISQRIARLKAAKRMKIIRGSDHIVVISHVGSFHASSARALLNLGADLAVIASEEKGNLRVSMRSKSKFFKKTKIHLGELSSELGLFFNGSGSGHPTAAGFNGREKLERFLIIIEEKIIQSIDQARIHRNN